MIKSTAQTITSNTTAKIVLGVLTLSVRNRVEQKRFYTEILGLSVLDDNTNQVILGFHGKPILILEEHSSLMKSAPGSAGLYHVALLFSSRKDLAETLMRIFTETPQLFTGSADHLVSEAFYLNDPEGNGVELYVDRDPSTWTWDGGKVHMSSLYLDPVTYIKTHSNTLSENQSRGVGHIHLRVGDIDVAKRFYVDVLGFDITAELPGALFVSVDRYHHHIGLNTWESAGAGKRERALGLKAMELQIHEGHIFTSILSRLQENEIPFTQEGNAINVHDPWHTAFRIVLSTAI